MEQKYEVTQFSTSEPFLKPGKEIFQVDLSGLIFKGCFKQLTTNGGSYPEVCAINEACEEHIRERQDAGVPLVVESEPVLIPWNGWFKNEYYILVHLKDEPTVRYYILNPIPVKAKRWVTKEDGGEELREVRILPLSFSSHGRYMEYIMDAESCAMRDY